MISVEAAYTVDPERFQYWTMAHPSKGIDIVIKYPSNYDVQLKPLVINEELVRITKHEGYVRAAYDSWALPTGGVAWRLVPKAVRVVDHGSDTKTAEKPTALVTEPL